MQQVPNLVSVWTMRLRQTKTRMVGKGIYFGLPKVFLLLDIITVLAVPATGQEGKNQTTNATRVEYMLLNKMDQKKKHMK